MKLDKLVMVEPRSTTNHVYSRFAIPRLGLPILGRVSAEKGIETRIFIEEIAPFDPDMLGWAELLCISAITPTATNAYALADRARARGIPVLLGGPHATYLPEEALDHADWVLQGEAETSFAIFLDTLRADGDLRNVPGLVFREGSEIVYQEQGCAQTNLDAVPRPDFSLIQGLDNGKFPRGIIPIATSRGCPHRCSFCSVTPMFGHKMRFASPEWVAEEIERLRHHGNMIFFYDDNFCASPKRTQALLQHLLDRGIDMPPWIAQVSVRAARDSEMLQLMQKTNCHTVFVGFESINNETLALYRKRQEVDDIRTAIRRFHQYGIGVHGMFVFGSDAEDISTIRATADFAIEEDIESVQFLVLTPFPGTPMFDEFEREGRLLTSDYSLFDAHHAVFQPQNMTPFQLMDETFKAMARVYSLRRTAGLLLRKGTQRAAISLYAAQQVKRWQRENRRLLRELKRVDQRHSQNDRPGPMLQLRHAFAVATL